MAGSNEGIMNQYTIPDTSWKPIQPETAGMSPKQRLRKDLECHIGTMTTNGFFLEVEIYIYNPKVTRYVDFGSYRFVQGQ